MIKYYYFISAMAFISSSYLTFTSTTIVIMISKSFLILFFVISTVTLILLTHLLYTPFLSPTTLISHTNITTSIAASLQQIENNGNNNNSLTTTKQIKSFTNTVKNMSSTTEEKKNIIMREPTPFNINFHSREPHRIVTNQRVPEGVGVYVRRSIGMNPRYFNPFALLDHFEFGPGSVDRGIGFEPHFHRGISTLTYMIEGSIQHEDHKGNKGILSAGDVQFMCAGKGIVHSEMPLSNNPINGMQLWVNLPKDQKYVDPKYQEYTSAQLPDVHTTDNKIAAKLIAGDALGEKASIITNTPVHYVHYRLQPDSFIQHSVPAHWSAFIYVLDGEGYVGNNATSFAKSGFVSKYQTCYFDSAPTPEATTGTGTATTTTTTTTSNPLSKDIGIAIATHDKPMDLVLIAGEPINDGAEVIQHGPMILNSREEVQRTIVDFRSGRNGFEGAAEFMHNWTPPRSIDPPQ
jgi:redox-sensitive bicupin YhaK (pirin superfamily)